MFPRMDPNRSMVDIQSITQKIGGIDSPKMHLGFPVKGSFL